MKFCKDCKHMVAVNLLFGATYPMCVHPEAPIDPVYGRKNGSCDLMRSPSCLISQCGVEGDWFEQAPPPEPVPEMKPYRIDLLETEPRKPFWDRVRRWLD